MNISWDENRQDQLIKLAQDDIHASLDFFKKATECAANIEDEDDQGGMDGMRRMQLVLQYRLDNQDALVKLFHCQQWLIQVLGISPLNSASTNLDRLEYAIGSEDVHQLLLMLNRLVDSLLRTIKALQAAKSNVEKTVKPQKQSRSEAVTNYLVQALDKQKSFAFVVAQLTQSLQGIAGGPVSGPTLDHVAQLRGPISGFHQALQHGLVLSAGLFQQLSNQTKLDLHLGDVLSKAQHVLNHVGQYVEKPRLSIPKNTVTTDRLEDRAFERRMKPFFYR